MPTGGYRSERATMTGELGTMPCQWPDTRHTSFQHVTRQQVQDAWPPGRTTRNHARERPCDLFVATQAQRARPKAQWHVDPKREAMARYHHKNACEQRCQLSWRSGVVRWCYEESRENGRTGPAGPWARIQIILSQDHRQVVLMAHMKFRAVPTSFDTVMVNHTAPRARPEPSQRFDPIKSARDPKRPYLGPTTAT